MMSKLREDETQKKRRQMNIMLTCEPVIRPTNKHVCKYCNQNYSHLRSLKAHQSSQKSICKGLAEQEKV